MVYSIVKCINGNYFIHAEGIEDLVSAKTQYYGLCQVLWSASDVYTGCVAIMDENFNVLNEHMEWYKANIYHDQPAPEPEPEPEPTPEPEET